MTGEGLAKLLVIGLTGGIASGKSVVSRYLAELGATIIDADDLARKLVQPHTSAWREIINHFGKNIVDEEGYLKRKMLGKIIFQESKERDVLNSILHPQIIKKTKELIALYRQNPDITMVVVDAPLLIEAGMIEMVDDVWVVTIPEKLQIKRLMERDKITIQEAHMKLNSQMPLAEKITYADKIIDNSQSIEDTKAMIHYLWESYRIK